MNFLIFKGKFKNKILTLTYEIIVTNPNPIKFHYKNGYPTESTLKLVIVEQQGNFNAWRLFKGDVYSRGTFIRVYQKKKKKESSI